MGHRGSTTRRAWRRHVQQRPPAPSHNFKPLCFTLGTLASFCYLTRKEKKTCGLRAARDRLGVERWEAHAGTPAGPDPSGQLSSPQVRGSTSPLQVWLAILFRGGTNASSSHRGNGSGHTASKEVADSGWAQSGCSGCPVLYSGFLRTAAKRPAATFSWCGRHHRHPHPAGSCCPLPDASTVPPCPRASSGPQKKLEVLGAPAAGVRAPVPSPLGGLTPTCLSVLLQWE